MSSVYSAYFSFNSPKSFSCNTSEKPMIALSGVRNSCDMLAKVFKSSMSSEPNLPTVAPYHQASDDAVSRSTKKREKRSKWRYLADSFLRFFRTVA